MYFRPEVERYRGLVGIYFRPQDVDKALYVIDHEHFGDPRINVLQFDRYGNQVGPASGLFQIEGREQHPGDLWRPTMQQLLDPETNVKTAAMMINRRGGWQDWGEGVTYQGKPFGSLGRFPYPGNTEPEPAPAAPQETQGRELTYTASAGAGAGGDILGQEPPMAPPNEPPKPWEEPLPDELPKVPLTPAQIMSRDTSPNELGQALVDNLLPGGWPAFVAEIQRRYGPPGTLAAGGPNTTAQILTQWEATAKATEADRAGKPAAAPAKGPTGPQDAEFGENAGGGVARAEAGGEAGAFDYPAAPGGAPYPGGATAQATAGGGSGAGAPGTTPAAGAKPATGPSTTANRPAFVSETDKRKQAFAQIESQLGANIKAVDRAADGSVTRFTAYNPSTEKAQRAVWNGYNDRYELSGDPFTLTRQMLTSAVQDQVFFNERNPRTGQRIYTDTGNELRYENGVQRIPLGGPAGETLRPEEIAPAFGVPLYNLPFHGYSPTEVAGGQAAFQRGILPPTGGAIPTSFTPQGRGGGLLMGQAQSPTGTPFGFGRTVGSDLGAYSTAGALGYRTSNFPDQAIAQELLAQQAIDQAVANGMDRYAFVGAMRRANFMDTEAPRIGVPIQGFRGDIAANRSPSGFFTDTFGRPILPSEYSAGQFGEGPTNQYQGIPMAPAGPGVIPSYQFGGFFPTAQPGETVEDPGFSTATGGGSAAPPDPNGIPSVNAAAPPPVDPNAPPPPPAEGTGSWVLQPDGTYVFQTFNPPRTLNTSGNTPDENLTFAAQMTDINMSEAEQKALNAASAGLLPQRRSDVEQTMAETGQLTGAAAVPQGLRQADITARQQELQDMQQFEWMQPLEARFTAGGLEPGWVGEGRRQGYAQAGRGLGIAGADIDYDTLARAIADARSGRTGQINLANIDFQAVARAIDEGRLGRRTDLDRTRLIAAASGQSPENRLANALASAQASSGARGALEAEARAQAEADAAKLASQLGGYPMSSPWQGGFGNYAPAGSGAGYSFPNQPYQFARGGSMTLPEPITGIGDITGTPYFRAAEAGNQERVGVDGGRLRFTPLRRPINAQYRVVA